MMSTVGVSVNSTFDLAPTVIDGSTYVATSRDNKYIEINDFATREELCDMIARLSETVYLQEIRIRKLEEIIKNGQDNRECTFVTSIDEF